MENNEIWMLIARKKGWALVPESYENVGEFKYIRGVDSNDYRHVNIPNWMTDISAAWKLAEEMGDQFLAIDRLEDATYRCWYLQLPDGFETYKESTTVQQAIGLAWLACKGVKVER